MMINIVLKVHIAFMLLKKAQDARSRFLDDTSFSDFDLISGGSIKPLLHYAGNLLATWWQKMVAGDCHHIFTPIIFY